MIVNPSLNDNILYWSKSKALADDQMISIITIEKLKLVLERIENIVGKGENVGYQHFLLLPQSFKKVSFSGSLKVETV